jgi:hypothetical protein
VLFIDPSREAGLYDVSGQIIQLWAASDRGVLIIDPGGPEAILKRSGAQLQQACAV